MRCPYCQSPLAEESDVCPSCQLNLPSLSSLLGAPSRIQKGLTDPQRVVRGKERQRITELMIEIHTYFPQINVFILLNAFHKDYPLATSLFWLFNKSHICPVDQKRGDNYTVLLGIDTLLGRMSVTMGYALEPFFTQKSLDFLLKESQRPLQSKAYGEAILIFLERFRDFLIGVAQDLPNMLGLPRESIIEESLF